MTVPEGVTLTVEPGVFVKSGGGAIEVQGGTLKAEGTEAEPVVFTSMADDSVGGDTGGSSTAHPFVNIRVNDGTLSLDHAQLRGAQDESLTLSGNCSGGCDELDPNLTASVKNTDLEGPLLAGWVDLSGFATEGAEANHFSGSPSQRAIVLREEVLWGQTLTLAPALNATLWGYQPGTPDPVKIKGGGQLRLRPGTFMKVETEVFDTGTLKAEGTEAEPVVFTSMADDSVGGDTGGSSTAHPFVNIRVNDGTLSLDHAQLRGAQDESLTLSGNCSGGCDELDPNLTASVKNTDLEGPLLAGWVDLSGFATEGAEANHFSGSPSQRAIVLREEVLWGQTLTLAPALNATLWGYQPGTPDPVKIKGGGQLRLRPGTFMKVETEVFDTGTLKAEGTEAEPVVFTSMADDSVGGDTGGSSTAHPFVNIRVNDGTLSLDHAQLRGAQDESLTLSGNCSGGCDELDPNLTASVKNTDLEGPLLAGWVDLSGFATEGAEANHFSGSPSQRAIVLREEVLWGQTLTLAPALNATLWGYQPGTPDPVKIKGGGQLRLRPGTFMKVETEVFDTGTLKAEGTEAEPVVFTSMADDSVGGDTGGSSTAHPFVNIRVNDGTLSLDHAQLRGAQDESLTLSGNCSGGCDELDPNLTASVKNTDLEGPLLAGWVDLSGFATEGAEANHFSGSPSQRAIVLREEVLWGQTLTLAPALNATLWGYQPGTPDPVKIKGGGQLRLRPGTFMKVETEVFDTGTLKAEGTEAEPVVFTSMADDSVGGDTGGSSTAHPFVNIRVNDSILSLDHAQLRGAQDESLTLSGNCSGGCDGLDPNLTASVKNTDLEGPLLAGWVDLSGFATEGAEANHFSGSPSQRAIVLREEVLWGQTLTLAPALNATLWGYQPGTPDPVKIKGGGQLRLRPGTFMKVETEVFDTGTLKAEGTEAEPVVFTSMADDSVGGDTGGDGEASSPKAGDWNGVVVRAGGTVDLEETTLRYASTAVFAGEGAEATIHGAILDSTIGVAGEDTFVDATEVDWGDPSGPAPIGSGTPYEGGGVLVTPWVGYVAPTVPPNPTPYVPPSTYDCANVAFIGARGSGESPQGDPPSFSGPEDGLGSRVEGAYHGFLQRPEQFAARRTSRSSDRSTEPWDGLQLVQVRTQAYFYSIYEGVDQLQEMIFYEENHRPGEKLVLAGHSQAAFVIHIALLNLASSDPSLLQSSHLAAVPMIADPAKVGHAAEETWERTSSSPAAGAERGWDLTKVPGLPHDEGILAVICRGADPGDPSLPRHRLRAGLGVCRYASHQL